MSKKNRKRSPEIPQVGNALEVPNYVVPMTDLEYKFVRDEVDTPDELALAPGERIMESRQR